MSDRRVIGPPDRNIIHKATNGGIRFKMRTTGHFPEISLLVQNDPTISLYKITLGHESKIFNWSDKQEKMIPTSCISSFNQLKEYYLTWFNNKLKIGFVDHKPFLEYYRIYTEPAIGFILFKVECRNSVPVEWILEVSPVILKPLPYKTFDDTLRWLPMVNGKLPPDAMIGGFEKGFTYIARAEHNNSLCPGKYKPATGKAYIAWGNMEHSKLKFEILCGYNAKWVPTRTNYIPQNAFIAGHSEVQNEPLYIGRAMVGEKLVPGKVHVRYNSCFLPCDSKEVEVASYEILVIPQNDIPGGILNNNIFKINESSYKIHE